MAAAAGLRLRFDKVAQRLVLRVRTALQAAAPGRAVIFTVTAPIRRPAVATAGIIRLAREADQGVRIVAQIEGNGVCLRRLDDHPLGGVLGFVHNPESDAAAILDLAAAALSPVSPRSNASTSA